MNLTDDIEFLIEIPMEALTKFCAAEYLKWKVLMERASEELDLCYNLLISYANAKSNQRNHTAIPQEIGTEFKVAYMDLVKTFKKIKGIEIFAVSTKEGEYWRYDTDWQIIGSGEAVSGEFALAARPEELKTLQESEIPFYFLVWVF